jgi:hypothetical protein
MEDIAPEASENLRLAVLVVDQNILGWDQWMFGRLSIHWGELFNK